MANTSRDVVYDGGSSRRIEKQIVKLQEQAALESVVDNYRFAGLIRRTEITMYATVIIAGFAAEAADKIQDIAGGSPLRATVVAPFLDSAVAGTLADVQQTTRR